MIPILLLVCLGLTGCGVGGSAENSSEKAIDFVKEACVEGDPKLTWQEITNLAAKAFTLDKSWNKFYESASSLAGIQAMTKVQSSWEDAPGNDGAQIAYINSKAYVVFLAECARLN